MSYQQMADFNDYLKKVRMDPECRVIVLTGEGKSFCAGFNLNELNYEPPEDMGRAQRDHCIMQTICSDQAVNMRNAMQPIIGALKAMQSAAVSLWLALVTCVFAANPSKCRLVTSILVLPVLICLAPIIFLAVVGYARAAEALMTARRIGAEELLEWGFANKVVADEES